MIFFHRPDCFHCGILKKKLEAYAKEAQEKNSEFEFLNIDLSLNEVGFNLKSFPTFRLYLKGNKNKPQTFNKQHNANGFNEFLSEHIKNFVKVDNEELLKDEVVDTKLNKNSTTLTVDKVIDVEDIKDLKNKNVEL